MDAFLHDLRQALRLFARAPGFALIAILTLGVGIGANTAIFSAIQGVLLRPVNAPDLDRIVVVGADFRELGLTDTWLTPREAADVVEREDLFSAAAALRMAAWSLTGAGDPVRVNGVETFGDFFGIFGVRPFLGRLFGPEQSTSGEHDVIVLGHGAWQRLTGGDPSIVGRTLYLDGVAREVIGVLPPGFDYPRGTEIYRPYPLTPAERQNLNNWLMKPVLGRMRPGLSREQIAAELDAQSAAWNREIYTGAAIGRELYAVPFVEHQAGELRLVLLVLMGAVGLVLLIACANVASLQLVRAGARARELAVRAAMGARRGRIVRQLLMESTVIALAGGLVGLLVADATLQLLGRWDPTRRHALDGLGLNGTVLAFTALVSLVAALASGLAPALRASRTTPADAFRASSGATADLSRHRLLKASVVVQVAMTLVLLLGTGLMIRSLARLLDTDPGFTPERLVTAQIALPRWRYEQTAERAAFYDALLERLRNTPGIEVAALGSPRPFSNQIRDSGPIELPGRPPAGPGEPERHAEYRVVSDDYFRTFGIPILAGRPLGSEEQVGAPRRIVVDEHFAELFFPGEEPIGREIVQFGQTATIVGVAGRVQHSQLGEDSKALIYYHYRQAGSPEFGLAVRTRLEPAAAIGLIRAAIAEVDPDIPVYDIATMEQRIRRSLGDRRFAMGALGAFAAVSLLLAMLGVYGVMRYSTTQRTREIGVRVALGATRESVLRMVIAQALVITGIGVVIGLGAALALSRFMDGLVFGITARDPVTFALVPVLVIVVAAAAAYLPARRAADVHPMEALRVE